MRIVVNDIAASLGGALTILRQFYNYVKDNDDTNEWIFLLGDHYLEETEHIKIICLPKVKKSHLTKLWFDCIVGRKFIASLQPDVVVSLQNIITFGVKCPQFVYIHQSIPFQKIKRYSFLKKDERSIALIQYGIGALIKLSAKEADCVVVQTQWMKDAVIESVKIPENKIITVFPKIDKIPNLGQQTVWNKKSFFYPTNAEPYKNIALIVSACDLLNKQGFYDFSVKLTLPENTITHPNIQCIGHLDNKQMGFFYCESTLLFPSLIETVGLPLIEARLFGTMILAGNTPFSQECMERYENVVFFDVFNAKELADKMREVLTGSRHLVNNTIPFEVKQGWDYFLQKIKEIQQNYGESRNLW